MTKVLSSSGGGLGNSEDDSDDHIDSESEAPGLDAARDAGDDPEEEE